MRLIRTKDLAFTEFVGDKIPPYAIISHRWTDEEVSFQDFINDRSIVLSGRKNSHGWNKIEKACEIARLRGFEWVWLDSCCIDKKSSAELTEAINSMFNWYRRSAECYVFLNDVHDTRVSSRIESQWKTRGNPDFQDEARFDHDQFRSSIWFTRSWTLQELLAPHNLFFFDSSFACFASKKSQGGMISEITGIPRSFLGGSPSSFRFSLFAASVAEKMRWASHRQATRKEDVAYSLLGIFNINLPLMYGEKGRAFYRLQTEIIRASNDETIFAWSQNDERSRDSIARTSLTWVARPILAPQISAFSECPHLRRSTYVPRQHYEVTNKGLRIRLPLSKAELAMKFGTRGGELKILWKLNCAAGDDISHHVDDKRSFFLLLKVRPEEAIATRSFRSPQLDFLVGSRNWPRNLITR